MVVTEGWPPNAERARMLLGPRGEEVVKVEAGDGLLPFPDQSFELVTSRPPVRPDWDEIRRVLMPGGHYFAQTWDRSQPSSSSSSSSGRLPMHAAAATRIERLRGPSGRAL